MAKKQVNIDGVIGWDVTARDVSDQLQAANGEDVDVLFSTPGGFIGEGLKMFNLLRNYSGKTTAILTGYAMSMGAYIPQACDEVVAEDNAVYMIHMASGGVYGDYKEIQTFGTYLEGLNDISAKQFVKSTTGRGAAKTLKEVKQMMEDTTYLFGDDMTKHGFVDSIKVGTGTDSETSMLTAKAAYAECEAKMFSDHSRLKADLKQANALMCAMNLTPPAAAVAGNQSKEVLQMSLIALLAANPTAKAEHDAAIQAAILQGKADGNKEMQETVKQVSPFLNNPAYPKQVGEMACKVLTGEQQQPSLVAMVSMADMMLEMQKGKEAGKETSGTRETQGQQQSTVADPSNVCDEASLQAAIDKAKGV